MNKLTPKSHPLKWKRTVDKSDGWIIHEASRDGYTFTIILSSGKTRKCVDVERTCYFDGDDEQTDRLYYARGYVSGTIKEFEKDIEFWRLGVVESTFDELLNRAALVASFVSP